MPALWPAVVPRSHHHRLKVNGLEVEVLHHSGVDFAIVEGGFPATVEVTAAAGMDQTVIRPLSKKIIPQADSQRLLFTLNHPVCLCLETPGLPSFFIYAHPPEAERPDRNDPNVLWFSGGAVHNVGTLHLKSGQTLYIESGAVVRGQIRALHAQNIRICGRGILDGGYGQLPPPGAGRLCVLENCQDVKIQDLTMIGPHSWMLVLGACQRVHVHHLQQIGTVMSSDGIDVCGSRHVLIEDCCLRNNDDCIAIKALDYSHRTHDAAISWARDVQDVTVRRCTFWNDRCGNAMEIGFELCCEKVSDILFEDIDVLCVHGHGAVFSIHVGDRALVENITWRNIRIEHHYDKLLDFRVLRARYSRDTQRGRIRRILLENIQIHRSVYNEGETKSLITGWSAETPAEQITLRGLFYDGSPVLDPDRLDLFTRHARDIRFEALT